MKLNWPIKILIYFLAIIVAFILLLYVIQFTKPSERISENKTLQQIINNITTPMEISYENICGNFTLPEGLKNRAITCEEAVDLLISKNIHPLYLSAFTGNYTEAYYVFVLKNNSKAWINIFTKEILIR